MVFFLFTDSDSVLLILSKTYVKLNKLLGCLFYKSQRPPIPDTAGFIYG
jgi:hypothetical protein